MANTPGTSVRVSPLAHTKLKMISFWTNATMGQVIEELLDDYLSTRQDLAEKISMLEQFDAFAETLNEES